MIEINEAFAIETKAYDPYLKTKGPGWCFRNGGHVEGISITTKNGTAYYPIRDQSMGNLDRSKVIGWLKEQIAKPIPKVFANAVYNIGWLSTEGIKIESNINDVLAMSALLDQPINKPTLDTYYELKDLVPKEVYQLEMDLVPVLIDMRKRGIRINEEKIICLHDTLEVERKKLLDEIYYRTGKRIRITNNQDIAELIKFLDIDLPKTTKSEKYSVKAEVLKGIDHPVVQMILDAKKIEKIRSSFTKNILEDFAVDGRVHCLFKPLPTQDGGTITGRFSCSNPNLQQIPSDKIFGPQVRSIFLPEEGHAWASLDYSQQEFRIMLHFASIYNLDGAKEAVNKYILDPSTDYHQTIADLCKIDRKLAKPINLGLIYGLGSGKLCKQLGLPTQNTVLKNGNVIETAGQEGKKLLDNYEKEVPFVFQLIKKVRQSAESQGYIETILGRVRRFPLIDGRLIGTKDSLNSKIQGSAADQTKKAMVMMYREGLKLLLTNHDENAMNFNDPKQVLLAKEIMENCLPLALPSKVDIETGPSWGECETFKNQY